MGPIQIFYGSALLSCCAIVAWKGEKEEKSITIAVVIASIISPFMQTSQTSELQFGLLAIDLFFLLFSIYVTLNSKKMWPIFVSGIQLSALMIHIAPAVNSSVSGKVYGNVGALWSYIILISLIWGSLVETRK